MITDKVNNVGVICGYPFPNGLAPTTRIIAYSNGLVQNGVDVNVFVFFPSDLKESNYVVDGEILGVKYTYPFTRKVSEFKIIRLVTFPIFIILTMWRIFRKHSKRRFDYIILSTDHFLFLYIFIPFVKLLGSRPVFIADEFPYPIRGKLRSSISQPRKFLFKGILRFADAMILMTEQLSIFYNNLVEKPTFILPSITDVSRFNVEARTEATSRKYLCYMGNMELSKDNVDNIITAFALIADKYPQIDLHLYGSPNQADLAILSNCIKVNSLGDRVIMKGVVSYNEVPKILKNSYLLVSSQPNTRRAMGGFPTKLGEYMSTEIPLLLVNVGEINKYVFDGVNGWLAQPNDPHDYASKMEYILDNYEVALSVAKNAKQYVMNNFDNKSVAKRLKSFLLNLAS